MKTGKPVESLSLSKFLILYMRNLQITFTIMIQQQLTNSIQHAISVLNLYVHNIIMDVLYKF